MLMRLESYPFLEIARRHGVDYGDVLCYADLCIKYETDEEPFKQHWDVLSPPDRFSESLRLEIINMACKPTHARRGTPRATS